MISPWFHIHPNAASLDLHLKVAGPKFSVFKDPIRLKSISVYGAASGEAKMLLRKKAEMLGGATVEFSELGNGFFRM